MLDALITLFAIFGIAYIIKESTIFSRPRSWLMQHSSFFAGLLYCYWCVGAWAGGIAYLLYHLHCPVAEFILWAAAGTAICGMGNAVLERLTTYKDTKDTQ